MENQYIWLYNHLDKYQFNTDKAKELRAEFDKIQLVNGQVPNEESMKKLKDCYNQLYEMLNDNPFSYINGLREVGVETNDLDCYFIENQNELIPIGYYKIKHPIESILLLNKKIQAQKEKTIDVKHKMMDAFEKEAAKISKTYETHKKLKQANYFRGSLATIASLMILFYVFTFLKLTNVIEIVKGIGDKKEFTQAVYDGMSNMPVFEKMGIVTWIFFLILHIAALVYMIFQIKSIKNEYVFSYQKGIAATYPKTSEKSIAKVNQQFDDLLEKDTQSVLDLVRKGLTTTFVRNVLSQILKRLRKKLNIARTYLSNGNYNKRGIQKNSTIFCLVLIATLGYFTYNIMANQNVKKTLDKWDYNITMFFAGDDLRGMKLAQLTEHDAKIYSSKSKDSKVKYVLPGGTIVEILAKEDVEGEEWSKIKLITETEIISGWVLASETVPYDEGDYSQYYEIPIVAYSSSSNLVGQQGEYNAFYAIDWNRETAWQDGNQYDSGEGEYIKLEFETETTIDMIRIFPGNAKSEEHYWNNERIKKAEIIFSGDQSFTYEFDDSFEQEYQTIWLSRPVTTSYVFIEIEEVYEGLSYTDSCVSEVHIFGKKSNLENTEDSEEIISQ